MREKEEGNCISKQNAEWGLELFLHHLPLVGWGCMGWWPGG